MPKHSYKQRLYAPGPVEVPPQVLEAMARPTIHHRTDAFKEIFLEVRAKLAALMSVPNEDALILAGSGTSAFEAGFLACVPKGSKVLGINAGKFGERWVKLAQTYGHEVIEMKLEWGRVADPEALKAVLKQHPDACAVMTTHSETSTGALHDIESLSKVVHETSDALFLVDCVTSLSVAEIKPKDWQLDGVFSGSQKGLMLPPGLGFAWLSERAWESKDNLNSSFYLDLRKERAAQQKGQTAYTPAVNLIYALNTVLDMLFEEGTEALLARREAHNQAILEAAIALGCKGYAERVSPAVAALYAPAGVAAPDIVTGFARRGIRIAGGQDHAKPVLFRPSVLGYSDAFDVVTLVSALESVLKELGQSFEAGSGVSRVLNLLDG